MEMNTKVEIDLANFLNSDEIREFAENVARKSIRGSLETQKDVERVVSNAAYAVVGERVKAALGKEMDEAITEKAKQLSLDEQSLKFCLYRDGRNYGDYQLGIVIKIAEDYVRQSCVSRIQSAVDRVLDKINFNTKKFEQMVVKEAAKIVAERVTKK